MRLWHQKLIHYLPDAQPLGLHREVCQLRHMPYKEWSKQPKNGMVGYVFKYDNSLLYQYHLLVLGEMRDRGMEPDPAWYNRLFCGHRNDILTLAQSDTYVYIKGSQYMIYPEHDDRYLWDCIENLENKGAVFVNGFNANRLRIESDLKGTKRCRTK